MKRSQNLASLSTDLSSNERLKDYIEFEQRVRYSETDQLGVAHNKSYFEWFEIGRTEFCRQRNIPYRDIEKKGYYLVVVEAFCRYKRPLRYDERFFIRVSLKDLKQKKAVFAYELVTEEDKKLIAFGYTVHISTDSKAKTRKLSPHIIKRLKGS